MKRKFTIRKTLAVLLLLLFAFSIAPKSYFHDLVANHVDYTGCTDNHTTAVLHQTEWNCHCDDLVVTAPFIHQAERPTMIVPVYHVSGISVYTTFYFTTSHNTSDYRGPPIV